MLISKIVITLNLLAGIIFSASAQDLENVRQEFSQISFTYDKVTGIGDEVGSTRRDPSDVIKVDDTWYVYYTKVFGHTAGYFGTVWYAVSKDEGYTWEEKGEILGKGAIGAFDSQATFTPNILSANGKYYLYYTGVKPTPGNKEGIFESNSTTDITAIGLAVSDSPSGPFERLGKEPVLKISVEIEKFDSYRIDDASLLYRNGLYWLYYKGRSRCKGRSAPGQTQMGTAFSKSPEGPFIKLDKPLLAESHEVLIWQQGTGVGALANLSNTFEYAPDGIDFLSDKLGMKVENWPSAPGAFRQDLTHPTIKGEGLEWGISMTNDGNGPYLIRYKNESFETSKN